MANFDMAETAKLTDERCDEIYAWLESNGWRSEKTPAHRTCDRVWYKRHRDTFTCQGNEDKPGVQLSLECWDWRGKLDERLGFQLDITAEPKDGVWVELKAYSMSDSDIQEKLDSQVTKLVRAWEACNG